MFRRKNSPVLGFDSGLYDQNSFYQAFERDLKHCQSEVIIESPFITASRMDKLFPILKKLAHRGVHIVINTRDPLEHDDEYRQQAEIALNQLHELDVTILYTVKHHRKLAVIDRQIIWEGSLNILSFTNSCEIMRRMASPAMAEELIGFIKVNTYTWR